MRRLLLSTLFLFAGLGAAPAADLDPLRELAVFKSAAMADDAWEKLEGGDRLAALAEALKGLPAEATEDELSTHFAPALEALLHALRSRSIRLDLGGESWAVVSPDGSRLVTAPTNPAGARRGVVLWNAEDGTEIAELLPAADSVQGGGAPLSAPAIDAQGRFVAVNAPKIDAVRIWRLSDGALHATLPLPYDAYGMGMGTTFVGERHLAAFGGSGGAARTGETVLWNIETGDRVHAVDPVSGCLALPIPHPSTTHFFYGAPPAAEGCPTDRLAIVAVALADGAAQVRMVVDGPGNNWNELSGVSPDGRRMALPLADGDLALLDLERGEEIARISGQDAAFSRYAFSPDGGRVSGERHDKTIPPQFSAETGEPLEGDTRLAPVLSRVASPSGATIGWEYGWRPWAWRRPDLAGLALIDAARAALPADLAAEVDAGRLAW